MCYTHSIKEKLANIKEQRMKMEAEFLLHSHSVFNLQYKLPQLFL